MKPVFFKTSSAFRAWLHKNHASRLELLVGFYKKDSKRPSITWPESVDAALCYGWIDGIRRSLDSDSYTIRFTPRKPRSTWSNVNIKKANELKRLGLMHSAGIAAFEKRTDDNSAIYSYEQRQSAELCAADRKKMRANKLAWEFFQSQPPSYRRIATYWVISAKKKETRQKRLNTLIENSASGQKIGPLRRPV
jgi:uncharacterized protein YdeI (YjbR/CyaY-like superfamily)